MNAKRFVTAIEEYIRILREGIHEETTKKTTKWEVKLFKGNYFVSWSNYHLSYSYLITVYTFTLNCTQIGFASEWMNTHGLELWYTMDITTVHI